MEDEVFEMDEFAVDPQRGAGIGKILAFDPAPPDRRTGNPLVETGVAFPLLFQSGRCHTRVEFSG
ncbi:hypothetical protein GGD54_004400 [Rhizobium tropici]|uniref:Uncharacterized protein n=1 Tax=Rhizobium tropici TaxID=398 RepID=A0ABR6R410_RHITR|nr:hypothetical protein [Rhizobium tropici]MBB5595908.1 hypothetical protein [Rhizobium tropici]MBB6493901.1 hypothetical protein [Rhizobium tropici]